MNLALVPIARPGDELRALLVEVDDESAFRKLERRTHPGNSATKYTYPHGTLPICNPGLNFGFPAEKEHTIVHDGNSRMVEWSLGSGKFGNRRFGHHGCSWLTGEVVSTPD